jgi:hypothetical protein
MLIACFHTWLGFWFWIHINLSCYLLLAEIVKTVLKVKIWPEQLLICLQDPDSDLYVRFTDPGFRIHI